MPTLTSLFASLLLVVPSGYMGWGVPWWTTAETPVAMQMTAVDPLAGGDADPIDEQQVEREEVTTEIAIDVVDDVEAARIDALLDRLSHNADDLRTITARITFQKYEGFGGVQTTRRGSFIYDADPNAESRRFAAVFTEWVRRTRKKYIQKDYVFDGRWLAEVDHERRQFIKREIVEPGDTRDPLKLGEGPFPLPLGQTTAEVRSRFSVTEIDVPSEGLLKVLPLDAIGLHLRPHPGSPAEQDFAEVFLYFDATTLLPIGSRVVEAALASGEHNEKLVLLQDVARNEPLSADEQARLSIEPPGDGWRVSITRWGEETTAAMDAD